MEGFKERLVNTKNNLKDDQEDEIRSILGPHIYDTFNKFIKSENPDKPEINTFPKDLINDLKVSEVGTLFNLTVINGPEKKLSFYEDQYYSFDPTIYSGIWIVNSINMDEYYGFRYKLKLGNHDIYLHVDLFYNKFGVICCGLTYLLDVNLSRCFDCCILNNLNNLNITKDSIMLYYDKTSTNSNVFKEYKVELNKVCETIENNTKVIIKYLEKVDKNYYTWLDAVGDAISEKKAFLSFKEKMS